MSLGLPSALLFLESDMQYRGKKIQYPKSIQPDRSQQATRHHKKPVSVLIGDWKESNTGWLFFELLRDRVFKDDYLLTAQISDHGETLIKLAEKNNFDIILLILNNLVHDPPCDDRLETSLMISSYLKDSFDAPVIAMTAWNEDGYAKRAQGVCDIFIPLPASIMKIAQVFKSFLEVKP